MVVAFVVVAFVVVAFVLPRQCCRVRAVAFVLSRSRSLLTLQSPRVSEREPNSLELCVNAERIGQADLVWLQANIDFPHIIEPTRFAAAFAGAISPRESPC